MVWLAVSQLKRRRSMTEHHIRTARSIVRNSAALVLVGVLSKAMGLVMAAMIARFLGPSATGLFALFFGIAIVVETLTSFGVPEVLVRDVAARPSESVRIYRAAVKIVLTASIIPAAALLIATYWFERGDPAHSTLLVLCISTPIASLFNVSQAVLQGQERMSLLTWTAFATRIASLAWLAFALWRGGDVDDAFLSRLLFLLGSVVVFFPKLWRRDDDPQTGISTRSVLVNSLPFLLHRLLVDIGARLPAFLLPSIAGLTKAGIFDVAERLRSTLGMTVQATMLGLIPAFARNFVGSGSKSDTLIAYSAKYVAISVSLVATGISVFAAWIIQLLFGNAFMEATLSLQILIWAQVVMAIDSVLKQAMLAARHEYSAVRRAVAGLLIHLVLIALLTYLFELPGAASAILIASTILFLLDLQFVVRHVAPIPIVRFIVTPLLSTALIGGVLIFVDENSIVMRLGIAVAGWAFSVLVLRLISREEAVLLSQVLFKRAAAKPAGP
jgi:O-antigen/teichoic acid export membrane protein